MGRGETDQREQEDCVQPSWLILDQDSVKEINWSDLVNQAEQSWAFFSMKKEVFLFKSVSLSLWRSLYPWLEHTFKDTLNILDIAQIDPSELHGTEASSFLL